MTKQKKQKAEFGKRRVFKAPATVGKDTVTVTLPKKVAEYLNLDNNEIFWAPVNGVIQMSGQLPHMVIPMMTVSEDGFEPQERAVVNEE